MSDLKKVVRVETRETIRESVIKTKRFDYKRGGYSLEETIRRYTRVAPVAVLECGHIREERQTGTVVTAAKKLRCYKCETAEDLSRDGAQERKQ